MPETTATDGPAATVFEVTITDNLVQSIRRVARGDDMTVPTSRLEVSSQLAGNHRRNGRLDGCYRFEDAEQARSFAVLALDFVRRDVDRRIESIEALDTGAEFDAFPGGAA